jgi:hypothetical protein
MNVFEPFTHINVPRGCGENYQGFEQVNQFAEWFGHRTSNGSLNIVEYIRG